MRNSFFRATIGMCSIVAAVHTIPVHAQEMALLAGPLVGESSRSYSWQMDYREGLGRYAAWSFSWLNEGHVPEHHRDGQALQIWGRLPLADGRFELSAGVGPYRYFDTVAAAAGEGYSNTHGWGAVLSVRAAYYATNRWIAQLQLNSVQANGEHNSTALLFGIGYQLEASSGDGPRSWPTPREPSSGSNELTAMLGETVLNSTASQTSVSEMLEYRRGLARHVDGTISYIHESVPTDPRRDGLAAQLWLKRSFFDDRLTLAAGAGPYLAVTHNDNAADAQLGDGRLAGLVSVSASYRLTPALLTRVTWNRVVTRYDRDSDIIVLGLGVRF